MKKKKTNLWCNGREKDKCREGEKNCCGAMLKRKVKEVKKKKKSE